MEKCNEGFVMEHDFEQWLKDKFYSWSTARFYTWRIRREYKRRGYTDLESFIRREIYKKSVIYVPKKSIPAFKKLAIYLATDSNIPIFPDTSFTIDFENIIEVREDTGAI